MIRGTLTIRSDLTEVASAREWVSALARQAGLSFQESYELQLALSEACTNSIKHAYSMEKGHVLKVSATIDDDQICLVIRDFGRKMDLQKYQKPNLEVPAESGYGIYLLWRFMNEVRFDVSHDKGTELALVKYRTSSTNSSIHPDSES